MVSHSCPGADPAAMLLAAAFSPSCRALIAQPSANENVVAFHKIQMLSAANLWGGHGKRADNTYELIGTTTVPIDVL